MPEPGTTTTLEVARYRLALTTSDEEYRAVLTCKDCRSAPVHGHPELEVPDPPICVVGTRRRLGAGIGIPALVPAAFRHEVGVHPPDGVTGRVGGRGAMVVTPDGLRSLARALDELAVLTKGAIALRVADVTICGGVEDRPTFSFAVGEAPA